MVVKDGFVPGPKREYEYYADTNELVDSRKNAKLECSKHDAILVNILDANEANFINNYLTENFGKNDNKNVA